MKPRIIEADTPEEVAVIAADLVQRQLELRPDSVLGLPTGETPLRMYGELVRRHRAGRLDLSRITSFNLDEYVGLPPDHPGSYAYYMREQLFGPIGLPAERTHMLPGTAADPQQAATAYEEAIRAAGGIDLQFLGIGINGHIGFNEPGSEHDSRTRLVDLTPETRVRNRNQFPGGQTPPAQALTMGIGTILEARRIVLLACGAAKARAIREALMGPVTSACPASALQSHPACTVLLDAEAARELHMEPARHAV